MARRRALLGRSADSGGASAFQRRLGGRKYQSSFGPGGTSADLIALGLGLDEPSRSDPTDAIPPDLTSTDANPPDLTSSDASPMETTGADPGAGPDSGPAQPQDTPAQEWTQEPGPPLLEGLPGPLVRPASASPAERQIAQHLVIELTDRIGDLLGMADTAHLLVQDVLEAAEADAVALLVPDGAVWRASGGIGLRAVERRMVLDGAHWLIEQVAHGGRIVALQGTNTEAARQRWAGAPLSAWRHLLAVPIPQVQAVVILARGPDSAPFADEQLSAIAVSLDGAGTALLSALQIRHLARLMDPLREVDPPPR